MSRQRHFTITAHDGVRLDALAQGPADRPPLILLHGFSDSRLSFDPLLAALPETVHAVAFSQRGHGASGKPEAPAAYHAERFADDVTAVLDTVGHPRGDVLGHSMGSWAALHTALRHPRRIDRLVLIGAFAGFAGNPGVGALGEDIAALTDPVDPDFVRGFQEAASSADLPAAFVESVVAESLRLPAHVWKSVFAAFLHDDVPPDLAPIRAATRLIWGDGDPFVPRADQDALLGALPAATLHVCEGLGHAPHWDRPDTVARLVLDHLGS
ncbi:MAG: alpha/beta fold hydrolase [Hyphomonas sp.]|nr:alpha/beta fold hydrolase [Hyphomonas sp.]